MPADDIHETMQRTTRPLKRSFAIKEVLDNQPGMAKTLACLGRLSGAAGNHDTALSYAIRACAPFDDFPNRHSTAPEDLARLSRTLGREAVAAAWLEVTGHALPRRIADAFDALADA